MQFTPNSNYHKKNPHQTSEITFINKKRKKKEGGHSHIPADSELLCLLIEITDTQKHHHTL